MGAEYLSYVKFIATRAPTFFGYIISVLACVYSSGSILHPFLGEVKFIYSEKAAKVFKFSTLLLSYVVPVKSKMEISQNVVAFSEYVNFIIWV